MACANEFGSTFRRLRRKREALGITDAYLCRVELGHKRPLRRELRDRAAEAIGVDPSELHEAAARANGLGMELRLNYRKGWLAALEWCLTECGSAAELRAKRDGVLGSIVSR